MPGDFTYIVLVNTQNHPKRGGIISDILVEEKGAQRVCVQPVDTQRNDTIRIQTLVCLIAWNIKDCFSLINLNRGFQNSLFSFGFTLTFRASEENI